MKLKRKLKSVGAKALTGIKFLFYVACIAGAFFLYIKLDPQPGPTHENIFTGNGTQYKITNTTRFQPYNGNPPYMTQPTNTTNYTRADNWTCQPVMNGTTNCWDGHKIQRCEVQNNSTLLCFK